MIDTDKLAQITTLEHGAHAPESGMMCAVGRGAVAEKEVGV